MDESKFETPRFSETGSLKERINLLEQENEALRADAKAEQMRMRQKLRMADHRAEQFYRQYNELVSTRLGKLLLKLRFWIIELRQEKMRSGKLYFVKWFLQKLRNPGRKNQNTFQEMSLEQTKWVDQYFDRIAQIPDSNGCKYYEKLPYRIGLICDEFFYESISAAADFVFITPENWRTSLDQGLDGMLFVTAWRGLHEEWRGLGAIKNQDSNPKRKLALRILDTCKKQQIPTIFYSKEDPPNFDVFLDYAKHCDYITTTAEECIPDYQRMCQNEHVRAVSFGINPVNHNPIGFHSEKKEDCVLFSGSWMLKYPERCGELSAIFDGILKSGHGLHIVDRNAPGNPQYHFPAKYFPYTSPALPHDLLQKVHKLFDWAVNINSVKKSHTMFANRAYELQANGVMLMSNFSRGVNELLPTVQIVHDSDEVPAIMDSLSGEALYERQIAGVRSVMTGHTCFDRIARILEPVGLKAEQPVRRILVLVDQITESVQQCFDLQTYPEKTLKCTDDISVQILEQYDMVTWFASDAEYGVYYLEDMINGFKYTACSYVTKDAWFEDGLLHKGVEHSYVNKMGSKYRTVFWRPDFDPDFLLNITGDMVLSNGYSVDHFNFNAIVRQHREKNSAYQLTVVIPVYNNGMHLYGKAFASLCRSSMFRKMEILLADKGSTDGVTGKILDDLEHRYENVRIFRLSNCANSEGIWSEAAVTASAPYVAILDPRSEAINDGYEKLFRCAESRDLVMGNIYRMDVKPWLQNQYVQFVQVTGADSTDAGMEKLLHMNWEPDAIQSLLIRKSLIQKLRVEKRGLSLKDLLQNAKHGTAIDVPVVMTYPGGID